CCIAAGNTMVLKLASMTPMTAMRLNELLYEAGFYMKNLKRKKLNKNVSSANHSAN
ncbi:MAG: aldehyde dehydrogenase family protein, partial [Proteobacteria bacterium]|nr:aldehyde dehydrogenase family protein [Pseudomonadota bacterium]